MAKLKKDKKRNFFVNSLRALVILLSLFLALFAFDTPFGIGFLIHFIPTIILLLTLILTWKNFLLAGILFILEGIATIFIFNTYRDWFVFLIISLVPIFIGIFFLILRYQKH